MQGQAQSRDRIDRAGSKKGKGLASDVGVTNN